MRKITAQPLARAAPAALWSCCLLASAAAVTAAASLLLLLLLLLYVLESKGLGFGGSQLLLLSVLEGKELFGLLKARFIIMKSDHLWHVIPNALQQVVVVRATYRMDG